VQIKWRLRMAAAQREVWTGAQLRRLLAERAGLRLSSASVSALLTRQPAQVKLETLAALCTALQCAPGDLIEVDTTPVPELPRIFRTGNLRLIHAASCPFRYSSKTSCGVR
jgi:putative transcriptional regulator